MFRLDHIGIAVTNLEEALELWRDGLGADVGDVETVEEQGVRVAFLKTGEAHTELLEATGEESPIAKFLASGKSGVHHLAYEVEDLAGTLQELKDHGVPLVHDRPVAGSRGTRIAFLHPRGTGGVLIELLQYPRDEGEGSEACE